jgi:MFS family permease
LMFPQTLTGIQLNFSDGARARAIGLYAVALSTGAIVGQIFGGVLISMNIAGTEWRAIFLINIPIAAGVIVAALRRLPADERRAERPIDVPGVIALTAAIVLVVLPLTVGRGAGWPAWSWACLAASAPAFIAFLVIEGRIAANHGPPLVNVGFIARPAISWALLALLIATGTYYALLFTLAQYLQHGLGDSTIVSGLTLVPWVAAFGVAGQIVRRLPPRAVPLAPVAGCLLLAASYAAISLMMFGGHHGEALLIVLLACGGLGLGIQFSALIAHLANATPEEFAPDISGVSTTTLQIGGAIGVAAFGTLYLTSSGSSGAGKATHAFAVTGAALAGSALAAAACALRATRPPSGRTRSPLHERPVVTRE